MKLALLFFAITSLLTACSGTPSAPSKEEKLGQIYFDGGTQDLNSGKFSEALANLLKASKYQPDSAATWNNLGLAYAAKGDTVKARESWQKALSIDSEFSDSRNNLGVLYFSEGKMDASEKEFKLVLKDLLYTKSFQVYYNLALIYLKERKTVQGEQYLKLSLKANKAYCPAWEKMGYLEKERGDYQAALESWRNAVGGTCYNNPELHYNVAGLYAHLHDKEKAKAKYLEIIELFPSSDWAKKAEANLNLMR